MGLIVSYCFKNYVSFSDSYVFLSQISLHSCHFISSSEQLTNIWYYCQSLRINFPFLVLYVCTLYFQSKMYYMSIVFVISTNLNCKLHVTTYRFAFVML